MIAGGVEHEPRTLCAQKQIPAFSRSNSIQDTTVGLAAHQSCGDESSARRAPCETGRKSWRQEFYDLA